MAAISSLVQRSSSSSDSSQSSEVQHAYFIAAVAIILFLIILRVLILRWRNQSMSKFFQIRGGSPYTYPTNEPSYGSAQQGAQLATLPAAHLSNRRVRAVDTDAQGRRLDHIGDSWDGKDALPAYDSHDRPPKYIEAGWGAPKSAMVPTGGERSGMAHPNTFNSVPEAS